MSSIRVLVDSTAGVNPELARRWGLGVVPFYLTWGERTYRDGMDLLPGDFYRMLAEADVNPKTAAPNPGDFGKECVAAFESGHDGVVIVSPSPKMSAAHPNACSAARELSEDRVKVVDSGQGAGAQALTAGRAAAVAARGAAIAEVVAAAEEARDRTELFMAVSTFRYLRRSGRLSPTRAMMGEAISLKPILTFSDGALSVIEKPRTMHRAIDRLMALATAGDLRQALVMYADDPSRAEELRRTLAERMPAASVDISPVSGVVGGHTGPGLLGIALLR